MKGIILAGGLGTRLYPLTRITNKHLLPVYNRPMIHYPIETLREAGIDDIMIVTGGNYAGEFLQLLRNGREFGLSDLRYAYQEGEGGIADALRHARDFVAGGRCIVVLGDNILEKSIRPYVEAFRAQATGARILIKEVPDPSRFGVPRMDDSGNIVQIIEKPEDPPSRYAVTGVYMFDGQVWDVLPGLKPSARDELEIADVNNWYIDRGLMRHDVLEGWWSDAGTFDSLLHASQLVAQREKGGAENVNDASA